MFWSARRREEQSARDRAELVAALRGLGQEPARARGSAWRTLRVAAFRWRRQVAPVAVICAVWFGGWVVDVSGVSAVTVGLVCVLVSGWLWRLRYRARLDRAPERLYAAVCLLAASGWLAAVAVVGL